jgi:tyrosinase
MATAVEINTLRRRNGEPLIRFDLRKLAEADLIDLRHAWEAMIGISDQQVGDRRGFIAVARGHGYDQDLCHSEPRLFLPWHRSYVYSLERRLNVALQIRRNDPSLAITMPYWDWTRTVPGSDDGDGIPRALSDGEYTDTGGVVRPNPLFQTRSLYRQEALRVEQVFTRRYTASFRGRSPLLAQLAADAVENRRYLDFNEALDNGAHGAVHVWVGGIGDPDIPNGRGDMAAVVSAAFDPLFWFHHCFVDKLWFDWQVRNGNQTFPDDLLEAPVYEGLIAEQTLDAEATLRYTYGNEVLGAGRGASIVDRGREEAPLPPTMRIDLGAVKDGFGVAKLELAGVRPPKDSVEVRVFVDQADARASTPTDAPTYAGSLYLFGHGHCFGAPGHCNPKLEPRDAYDLRPAHPLKARTYRVDITRALRHALAKPPPLPAGVELQFVVVDAAGKQVPPSQIEFDALSVITR